MQEVETLWGAICSWPGNLRVTLNYLARLIYVSGNLGVMVVQAKRIAVSLSRSKASLLISELIRDLQVSVCNARQCMDYMYMYVY